MWPKVETNELLKDLWRVRRKIGKWPSVREYKKFGRHSPTSYVKRFGSWKRALNVAKRELRKRK